MKFSNLECSGGGYLKATKIQTSARNCVDVVSKAQEKHNASAAKKKPAAAAQPRGVSRKDHRWDGEHEFVESGGVGHYVGAGRQACWTRAASTKMMNSRRRT